MTTNRSRLVAQVLTAQVAPPLLTSDRDAERFAVRVARTVPARVMGSGVGRQTLLTSAGGAIEPPLDARANLATILALR